jgi:hypothetical protein
MGMFRSVQMDLSCQRCGRSHPAEVQFKTGKDWCEVHAVGDRVDDLPAGEAWEGIADRFCGSCQVEHRVERERAMATVLAALVRAGQLELKLAEAEAPLTPDELMARGEEQAEAARRSSVMHGMTLVLTGLCCLVPGDGWTARFPTAQWLVVYEALHEEMRRRGWPHGDDSFREDLSVYLDGDRQLRVRLIET